MIGISAVALLGLSVLPASAQVFRRTIRPPTPAQVRPGVSPFFFNNGVTAGFQGPTLLRATPGSFNPNTGAFNPNQTGPFVLSRRGGFEPIPGTFAPNPTGNFVLSAREAFNPSTGNFFPSTTGNIVLRERGNFLPANNNTFVQSANGSINLSNGAFVPNANGGVTLSTRGLFVPANGTFIASPMGNFVLTTRQNFDPNTGTFVQSPTGAFASMTRGTFVPTSGTLPSGVPAISLALNNGTISRFNNNTNGINGINPINPLNPLNQMAFTMSPFFNAFRNGVAVGSALTNPYFPTAVSGYPNPYAYPGNGSAYGTGSSTAAYGGGYVAPAYGAGYGNGGYYSPVNNGAQQAQPTAIPAYNGTATQGRQPSVLGAFGVPSEDNMVNWPLAFRLMSPEQRRTFLEPLEGNLQAAATQAAAGTANPSILRQARLSVDDLRDWLRSRRTEMAEGTYRDGEAFLRKLDTALQSMRASS